ncbi:MAG TPA: hypothetical protein VG841_13180 [Caulobacterales bacterium]|nr:hypothetical protein [Caulobacterales bacterium]
MTKEELAEDLAYVRTLAEEGRETPLVGGSFLILFGTLLSIGYLAHWAALTNLFGRTPAVVFGYIWLGYGVLAVLGAFILFRRVRALPGRASVANRVDRIVWRSSGIAITVVVLGCMTRMTLMSDQYAANAIMASAFALFGVALGVTAAVSNQGWLRTFSLLAFATSVVLWIYINEPWAYLLAALASVIVLLAPGIILVRREPSPVA